MIKVDILMASYNGAKYIHAQIASVVAQSYTNWRLLIHDDGSTDNTVNIIKEWCMKDSRIVLIDDGVKCGGASANFMHLTRLADAEFVMYADQDDIWFDNKVEYMVKQMEKKDHSKPQLHYTNLYVWLAEKGITGNPVRTFPTDLKHFLFWNTSLHGCISIFNRCLLRLLQQWDGPTPMHDQSLQLLGIAFGEVTYNNTPLMLYRRHSASVTGDTITHLNGVNRLLHSRKIPVIFEAWYEMVVYFEQQYGKELTTRQIKTVQLFLNLKSRSKWGKIVGILQGGFKLYNSTIRLVVKILLRPYMA